MNASCLTCQVESRGTESDGAGAEKEDGSAGGGEGRGGGEAERCEVGSEEPREEEQRGAATSPRPQTELGSAV